MSLETMLESIGTLKRPTISKDSYKGTIQTGFSTIVSDRKCSVQPASPEVATLYAQRNVSVTVSIYLSSSIGAQINDIFVVTDRDGVEHTYQVRGESKDLLNRIQGPYRMDCAEVKK